MNKAHGSQDSCPYSCPRDFEEDGFDGGLAETHSSGYLNLADIAEVLWKEGDCLREGGRNEGREEGREGGREGREGGREEGKEGITTRPCSKHLTGIIMPDGVTHMQTGQHLT